MQLKLSLRLNGVLYGDLNSKFEIESGTRLNLLEKPVLKPPYTLITIIVILCYLVHTSIQSDLHLFLPIRGQPPLKQCWAFLKGRILVATPGLEPPTFLTLDPAP